MNGKESFHQRNPSGKASGTHRNTAGPRVFGKYVCAGAAMGRGKTFNTLGPLRQKLPEESRHAKM